ncbi:MAG TPA: hypothetical protein VF707_07460 [Ardenticatenaceae bacterium]
MKRILVAYGTRNGLMAEVAQAIGERLRQRGEDQLFQTQEALS